MSNISRRAFLKDFGGAGVAAVGIGRALKAASEQGAVVQDARTIETRIEEAPNGKGTFLDEARVQERAAKYEGPESGIAESERRRIIDAIAVFFDEQKIKELSFNKKVAENVVNIESMISSTGEEPDDKLEEEIKSWLEKKGLYDRDLSNAFYTLLRKKQGAIPFHAPIGYMLDDCPPYIAAEYVRVSEKVDKITNNTGKYSVHIDHDRVDIFFSGQRELSITINKN